MLTNTPAAPLELLREVSTSGVEFEDDRINYVTVQIDKETWQEIQRWRTVTPAATADVSEMTKGFMLETYGEAKDYGQEWWLEKLGEAYAAMLYALKAATPAAEKGLSLLRQLVSGKNALRDFDVFPCNDSTHDDNEKCECFWEQCEAWAKSEG